MLTAILVGIIGGVIIAIVKVVIESNMKKENINSFNNFQQSLDSSSFTVTKRFEYDGNAFCIDDERKLFTVSNGSNKIYKYSDLANYDIEEDGNTVTQGRTGSTLVGGALFGVTGAIAGSARSRKTTATCTSLRVIIHINDINFPLFVFPFIDAEMNKDGLLGASTYKLCKALCDELVSMLSYVINSEEEQEQLRITGSEAGIKTQLKELKELYEEGLITEDEYSAKKKSLLSEV